MEHGTFTPLVMSTTGGMDRAASVLYITTQCEKRSSLQQNHGLDPLPAKFCSIEIILDVHQGG